MRERNRGAREEKWWTRRDFLRYTAIGAGTLVAAAGIAYIGITAAQPEKAPLERSGEFADTPSWSQDFLDPAMTQLDPNLWQYNTNPEVPGYNGELQGYTDSPTNVRIEPEVGLVIEAVEQDFQYENDPTGTPYTYTSARIDTLPSLKFDYGKIEATMKLPEGRGVWPAFWLMSASEIHTQGSDPALFEEDERYYMKDGEIDIMEYYGDNPTIIEGSVHTYNKSIERLTPLLSATDEFHTYGAEITPNSIFFTIDGRPYGSYERQSNNPDDWPFTEGNQLYVIINLAMGGPAGEPGDADPSKPWRLEVQNLRFFEYIGDD